MNNLVVVESPAKAKTIEKILGKDFKVTSCYGHVRDLAKSKMGIDIENNYHPSYVVPDDKKKLVAELKKLAKNTENVWLATDEDREGEAISWHLCEVLDLDPAFTKRIVFHEITKSAIEKAVARPRTINADLVNAQQARRILDRLVGFYLSPILIRKIPNSGSLSAGRVQSVALRLIVERNRSIENYVPSISYRPKALFTGKGKDTGTLCQAQGKVLKKEEEVLALLERCKEDTFLVEKVEKKPGYRKPIAPFTTSTLQQEAARKLGYDVNRTMLVAQKLYEAGRITYMRTDSVTLSKSATDSIQQYVEEHYGKEYHQFRQYNAKSKSVQEAHEAIRPTDVHVEKVPEVGNQSIYDLIRKRTLASQMADAKIERTTINITTAKSRDTFTAKGEVVTFEGFLKAYQESKDDDYTDQEDAGRLPVFKEGQHLSLVTIEVRPKRSRPEANYTEASLVKKMEELGIGRPSTYAPTIAVIQKRGYVVKKTTEGKVRAIEVYRLENNNVTKQLEQETYDIEKNKLFPSDLGVIVSDFLVKHFEKVMDYQFTANLEENFDAIAEGAEKWTEIVNNFFTPFQNTVSKVQESAERVSGEKILGTHPDTKQKIIVRMGRYGPMVQMGEKEGNEKPKYAKLLPSQQMSTISLDEALLLLSLPKELGKIDGKTIVVNQGPYGPYIKYDNAFYSIPKADNMFELNLERARAIIFEKKTRDANSLIKEFPEQNIQILSGRYGVYVKAHKKNYKLSKEQKKHASNLSLEDVQTLIEEQDSKFSKRRRFFKKKN